MLDSELLSKEEYIRLLYFRIKIMNTHTIFFKGMSLSFRLKSYNGRSVICHRLLATILWYYDRDEEPVEDLSRLLIKEL